MLLMLTFQKQGSYINVIALAISPHLFYLNFSIMKKILLLSIVFVFLPFIQSVSAEENRNQYSTSIMFKAPETHENTNHKTESDLHNQHCLDLQKKIKDLEFLPVRRNAARERYKTECLNK